MEAEHTARGTVKEVLSGDTVVLYVQKPGAPPAELQVTFSRVSAPQLGRAKSKGKEAVADKPFAWEAREFLRKLTIGKVVTFKVVRQLDSGRTFANVQLEGADVAVTLLEEGLVTVSAPPGGVKEGSGLEAYTAAEERGRAAERGQHSKVPAVVRPRNDPDLAELCKAKNVQGIIERVLNGSSYRVTLLPSLHNVAVQLAGTSCPDFIADPENPENKKPEPFAREAKYFVDSHVLHRVVDLTIHGRSRFELLASVSYAGHSVEEELLRMGLAKLNTGAGTLDKATQERLGKAERVAREQAIRIWTGQTFSATPAPKVDNNQFLGTVLQVGNGGQLLVLDPSGQHRAVFLSSLRFPSAGNPKESYDANEESSKRYTKEQLVQLRSDRAWAVAGTEYLRKTLIGKKVQVRLDFLRDSQKEGEGKRAYCTVIADKLNIGQSLVSKGLCSVVTHRGDEPRALNYSDYLTEEEAAKKAQLGVHGPREKAPVARVKDMTINPTMQAAKQYLGFLQRDGQIRGIIEHIFNAGRYKIHIPREQCTIFFSLAGVRPPSREDAVERPAYERGIRYVLENFNQREIDIEVESVDKNGGFVGRIYYQSENVALPLLENGFVTVFGPAADRATYGSMYRDAERAAQRNKHGVWVNYDEAEEKRKEDDRKRAEEDKYNSSGETLKVVLSEVVDGSHFFFQIDSPEAQALEEMMAELQVELGGPIQPVVGELVRAQFSADDRWYRAQIKKVGAGQAVVSYIDYGNEDTLGLQRVRALAPKHRILKPQAIPAVLAFIKTPPLGDEFGEAAAALFREVGLNRPLSARVEHREGNTVFVSLATDTGESINGILVREGLARLESHLPARHPMVNILREDERVAKNARANLWQYGTSYWGDDDDPATL